MVAKNKILITGSNGLIGSALERFLKNIGLETRGIDINYPPNHPNHKNIQYLKLIKEAAADCKGIVHLAAVSRVILGEQNPILCWKTNVEGTRTVLEAANHLLHKPWVIYASSREVYGQQAILPVTEKAPLLPLNTYARSKAMAEKLVIAYRKKGVQTATLRFSNVYGSIDDYSDRVIPAFCRAAAWGKTIRIDGGHNTFDFTHVNDVVIGIVKMIDQLQKGVMDLPPIHFTTGQGTTLFEAAQLVKSLSQYPLNFVEAPPRSFDVSRFYGDPTCAKRLLNWEAKISLQQGFAELINQFKNQVEPTVVNAN